MTEKYSIIPPTGAVGITNPNLPQGKNGGISAAGWTYGNEGFIQQTFLGASIRNFNIVAGFGDTTSTLSVELINDEYNTSDKTGLGIGDDVYHDGKKDFFKPPPVGSPVFFKFGKNHATIEQAWRRYFDQLVQGNPYYEDGLGYPTISSRDYQDPPFIDISNPNSAISLGYLYDIENAKWRDLSDRKVSDDIYAGDMDDEDGRPSDKYYDRGKDHFIFGGILQSYTQNKSVNGNPLFSVQVVDPREILSSVEVILNNYTGSMYGNKNFINVYGFLEYDISDDLREFFAENAKKGYLTTVSGVIEKKSYWINNDIKKQDNKLERIDPKLENENEFDNPKWIGTDMYYFDNVTYQEDSLPQFFPMTGEAMSRRCDQGIPWYRVRQSLEALFEIRGKLPQEYKNAGFGTQIDFRGFNYIVDFGGIPLDKIPQMYFIDYDKLDLLSLMQEICDIISHDLYVTLLPIINHPVCLDLYKKNQEYIKSKQFSKIITGIIRIEAIPRNDEPSIGAVKEYIEKLKEERNIQVENQDIGYELTNVTTDKVIVGAQESLIHFFGSEFDRDEFWIDQRNKNQIDQGALQTIQKNQWTLETALNQQILPFYGFIGKNVPSIPRGWGPYQQILLDATGLDAHGVGRYYIATEMELRAALVSYEQWARFLLQYNETYIEEIGENSFFYKELYSGMEDNGDNSLKIDESKWFDDEVLMGSEKPLWLINRKFGVTVPRCVFVSEQNEMGEDGYPASPCSPPFGYPLYYKRAEKIGIPEAGIVKYQNAIVEVITNYEKLLAESDGTVDLILLYNEQVDQQLNRDLIYLAKELAGTLSEEEYNQLMIDYHKLYSQAEKIKTLKQIEKQVAIIREQLTSNGKLIKLINQLSRKHLKNAKKVYQFVRGIAEENLGKKFLVKIPRGSNLLFSKEIKNPTVNDNVFFQSQSRAYKENPYGFPPKFIWNDHKLSNEFYSTTKEKFRSYLDNMPEDNRPKNLFETFSNILDNWDELLKKGDIYSLLPYTSYNISFDQWRLIEEKVVKDNVIINHNYYDINMENTDSIRRNAYEWFTEGGLKGNFNPISNAWQFNYKPEPQGGYYHHTIFKNYGIENIKPNDITRPLLIPSDLTNFVSNGRVTAYVRYDHSQYLDFSSVGSDNVYQINAKDFNLPDIMEELNNISDIDNIQSFDAISEITNENGGNKKTPHIAFVKCDVDEQFYMLPKTVWSKTLVYAQQTEWTPNARSLKKIEINVSGCKRIVPAQPYPLPIFRVAESGKKGGSNDTETFILEFARKQQEENEKVFLIDTKEEHLDPYNVYALITIPGRIIPTIDKRYHDGPYKAINGADISHILAQDATIAPDYFRFNSFSNIAGKEQPIDCNKFNFNDLTNAQRIQKIILQNISFADPNINIGFTQPSPVYPNLVAIPILSTENCFGPWFSSSIVQGWNNSGVRYKNIGGKVEFIKDENLAPWNYGGYSLMNEAGKLQAQHSNSLLLFSERGGITYPDIPAGIDLAKPLNNKDWNDEKRKSFGPLVTSISVDVNDTNIKTTIKMDLYTSRFGKLQKQKDAFIAQGARMLQKAQDLKNQQIRAGFRKGFSNNDIMREIKNQGADNLIQLAKNTSDLFESYQNNKPLPSIITISANKSSEQVATPNGTQKLNYSQPIGSMQTTNDLSSRMSLAADDPALFNNLYNQTAGSTLGQMFTGYETLPINSILPYFATMQYTNRYLEDERT